MEDMEDRLPLLDDSSEFAWEGSDSTAALAGSWCSAAGSRCVSIAAGGLLLKRFAAFIDAALCFSSSFLRFFSCCAFSLFSRSTTLFRSFRSRSSP
jgi:hypothetical protein